MKTESSADPTFQLAKTDGPHHIVPRGDGSDPYEILSRMERLGDIMRFAPFIEGIRYIAEHFSRQAENETPQQGKHSWYLSEPAKAMLDLCAISGELMLISTILEKKYIQQVTDADSQQSTIGDDKALELIKYYLSLLIVARDKTGNEYKDEHAHLKTWIDGKIANIQHKLQSLTEQGRPEKIVGTIEIDHILGMQNPITKILLRSPDTLKFWGNMQMGYARYQQQVLVNMHDGLDRVVSPKNYLPFVNSMGIVEGMAGKVEIAQVAEAVEHLFPELTKADPVRFLQLVGDYLHHGQGRPQISVE